MATALDKDIAGDARRMDAVLAFCDGRDRQSG